MTLYGLLPKAETCDSGLCELLFLRGRRVRGEDIWASSRWGQAEKSTLKNGGFLQYTTQVAGSKKGNFRGRKEP